MLKLTSLAKWGAAVLLLSSLTSCEDILEQYFPKPNPTPPTIPTFPPLGQDIAFYALAGGTRLDGYSTTNAATRTSSVAISGLQSGETLLAIDFRPATGQLYGVSSASRLYVINQNTGVARAIGAGAFSPAVAGNLVGFDFNPTVDRIRLVTSTGQNLRLNPETGTVAATDGVLNGAAGATITGAAYTNNTAGTTSTVLYDLDPATDQLYRQDPPNDGTLVAVGPLNLNITGDGGFDIDARTGTALGLYAVNGNPTLFSVDLSTGAARPLAQYSASQGYSGIAISTLPVGYAIDAGRNGRNPGEFSNELLIVDLINSTEQRFRTISGVKDQVVGLDFRPATGQLYALTQGIAGQLYTIDLGTGAATLVATISLPLGGDGIAYGFDFDPVADRIRITSSSGLNLRVNPTDGTAIADGRIDRAPLAAAYDNNYTGATTSTLYVVASSLATGPILYQQNPPNAGTLVAIAPLSESVGHLDIGGITNTAYGARPSGNTGMIYTINLITGEATPVRRLPTGNMSAFAVGLGS